MFDFVRFVFEVLTNLLFVPALVPLAQQRRHFSLFVGVAQVLAAFCYCLCDFFHLSSLFILNSSWHFMSDVLSLTYACLAIIHLCAFEDEEKNLVLRYLAFFSSWIFKYRDAWDVVYWEAVLVVGFVLLLLYSHITVPMRRKRFRRDVLNRTLAVSLASVVLFLGHLKINDQHKLLLGFTHCGAAWALFDLWNVLPAPSKEKRLDSAAMFV